MSRAQSPVFSIPTSRIDGFLADKVCFRDAKARTPHPALVLEKDAQNNHHMQVWDRFLLKHEYRISKDQGERFVDVTNDNNLIHRKGNIVPGAMTISKIILPLEILFPELEISSVNIKFTGSAYYGERACNLFSWQFVSSDYIQIEIKTYQQSRIIATAIILGKLRAANKHSKEISEDMVNKVCFAKVREYFDTLEIRSDFYVNKEGYKDYTYPLAYIASLPSAEIVNQLSGQGGMINILRLDFGSYDRVPITGDKCPEVKLARAKKRNTFNKIMTEIAGGLVTYCRGLAIVNPIAKFQTSMEPIQDAAEKLLHSPDETLPLCGINDG